VGQFSVGINKQRLDDHHRRTTVNTNEGWSNRVGGRVSKLWIGGGHRCNLQQFTCQRQILLARIVGDQPIVTNPVKAAGRN